MKIQRLTFTYTVDVPVYEVGEFIRFIDCEMTTHKARQLKMAGKVWEVSAYRPPTSHLESGRVKLKNEETETWWGTWMVEPR